QNARLVVVEDGSGLTQRRPTRTQHVALPRHIFFVGHVIRVLPIPVRKGTTAPLATTTTTPQSSMSWVVPKPIGKPAARGVAEVVGRAGEDEIRRRKVRQHIQAIPVVNRDPVLLVI